MIVSRVRVKICGITRVEDALAAVAAGADAIGLVFYPPSPRAVSLEQAASIVAALPAFVTVTGLFVDPAREQVDNVLAQVPLSLLQFHGDEDAAFCEQFAMSYIKAVRMPVAPGQGGPEAVVVKSVAESGAAHPRASGLLFDTLVAGEAGGTGKVFDWSQLPDSGALPLILAGGLDPANVARAIKTVRPYAVDVSSGVEATPGLKDSQRVADFIAAVSAAG